MIDRVITAVLALAAVALLLYFGAAMQADSGHVPSLEGPEVGGEEEAAEEVGGEEEAAPQTDHHLLPEGEHRDLVVATCTACHGAALVASQRMDRKAWDETITWMQKTQALWELNGEQRGQVLDYLATHFGPGEATTSDSPWAHPLYEPNPLW